MQKFIKTFWEFYFIFYTAMAFKKVILFFSPGTNIYFYHYFLYAFNNLFYFNYFLNILQMVFTLVGCFGLWFYVSKKDAGSKHFWGSVFFLRLIFDIAGNSYDQQTFIALFNSSPRITSILIASTVIYHVPSYYANFKYAFLNNAKK